MAQEIDTRKEGQTSTGTHEAEDILSLLRNDHASVLQLFEEEEALPEGATDRKRELFERIALEFLIHARIEESIFYPALQESAQKGSEQRENIIEAYEEHDLAKSLISAIETLDSGEERYQSKISVLHDIVERHIQEEEMDIFVQAVSLGEKRLDELGEQYIDMKAREKEGRQDERHVSKTASGTATRYSERDAAETANRQA